MMVVAGRIVVGRQAQRERARRALRRLGLRLHRDCLVDERTQVVVRSGVSIVELVKEHNLLRPYEQPEDAPETNEEPLAVAM